MASIVAIGNPGSGKSTILNAMAGEVLFESGISFGKGLTYQLDERQNERGNFVDTPGLADKIHREAAGKAISTVLKRGGACKILFFMSQNSGRVVEEDVATLRLVLDAAPEIENNYGIVINRVHENVMKGFENPENLEEFYLCLYNGIPNAMRCPASNVFYIRIIPELDSVDNKLIPLESLEDGQFLRFVYVDVPVINLTPNKATDVKINQFGEAVEELKRLRKELKENKKMQNDLLEQLCKVEDEKRGMAEHYRNEVQRNHETAVAALKDRLAEMDERISDSNEQQALREQKHRLELEQQQLQYQNMVENQNSSSQFMDLLGGILEGLTPLVIPFVSKLAGI